MSYTKAPEWIKLIPGEINDKHTTFWALASLGFPNIRDRELVPPRASDMHGVRLPPDQQLLCYDYLYYVCALKVGIQCPASKPSTLNICISPSSINLIIAQHGDSLRSI